jgi:hypothetical protein
MFRQPRYPEKLIFEYKNIKSDHTYWVNEEELKKIYELLPSEILRDEEPNIPIFQNLLS